MTARLVTGAGWAAGLLVILAVLGSCGFGGGGEPESRLTMPTRTPPPEPGVSELVVCDSTVDCGDPPGRGAWASIQVCLRVAAARDGLRVFLAATREDRPPTSAFSPNVVARSEAVPASETFACHNVLALDRPLTAGEYWLWVLDGTKRLGRTRFVLSP